jgi:hypothetical protein
MPSRCLDQLCTLFVLLAAAHREEVRTDCKSAAKFSSLTVIDDGAFAVAVHSSGCGIGCLGRGGLAWRCQSAARILSAGVISSSKKSSAVVLEEIRVKTSLVLRIPRRPLAARARIQIALLASV